MGHGLLGSANQKVHLLTGRYTPDQLSSVPSRELILHRDGTVAISGISPWVGVREIEAVALHTTARSKNSRAR